MSQSGSAKSNTENQQRDVDQSYTSVDPKLIEMIHKTAKAGGKIDAKLVLQMLQAPNNTKVQNQ